MLSAAVIVRLPESESSRAGRQTGGVVPDGPATTMTLRNIMQHFADHTTMHGVPKVIGAALHNQSSYESNQANQSY